MLGAVVKILIGAILGILFLIAMAFAFASDMFTEESAPPKRSDAADRTKLSVIDEART